MITDFSSIIRNILLLKGAKGLKTTAQNVETTKNNTAQTAQSIQETKDSINKSTQTNSKIYGKMNSISAKTGEILDNVKPANDLNNGTSSNDDRLSSNPSSTTTPWLNPGYLQSVVEASLKASMSKESETVQKQGHAEVKKQYDNVKRKGKEIA